MSDLAYPQESILTSGTRLQAPGQQIGISISLCQPVSIVHAGAWPDSLDTVLRKLGSLCGSVLANEPGTCGISADAIAVCLSPGRFLILSDTPGWSRRLQETLLPEEAAALDLSQSRAGFRIAGTQATSLLAKGAAVDFDDLVFPPGKAMQTTIDHTGVLIVRRKTTTFDLFVPGSFGQAFAEWLIDAAMEYGYRIEDPVSLMPQQP